MLDYSALIPLPDRAEIVVSGKDAEAFLQRLITNDMAQLAEKPLIYACLLSPQGKFLFDFLIRKGDAETFFLDCDATRADELATTLNRYKLRSALTVTHNGPLAVHADLKGEHGLPDPRHWGLGSRCYGYEGEATGNFSDWDKTRITLTIPDAVKDVEIGFSTLEELNIPNLHGVSYNKGCYVGQELTARMHHRGLGKKHLRTVRFATTPPEHGTELDNDLGIVKSSIGNMGLVLVKDGQLENFPPEIGTVL